ncbi:MAG: L-threonylcarbamoyladenylate synthase [Rikenellaceae bacterium]
MRERQESKVNQSVIDTVEVLRKGGIILYPTDTVWGVGCDATNAEAVAKVYALKRSENKKAMIVLCNSLDMAVRYVKRPPLVAFEVMELATKPLTAILPGGVGVAPNLIPEEGTLAIRVPDHQFCQDVIRRLGKPLVSTSANISGEATPKRLDEISKEIVEGVDYIVAPRMEGHSTRQPSSIIRFEEDGTFEIIRE